MVTRQLERALAVWTPHLDESDVAALTAAIGSRWRYDSFSDDLRSPASLPDRPRLDLRVRAWLRGGAVDLGRVASTLASLGPADDGSEIPGAAPCRQSPRILRSAADRLDSLGDREELHGLSHVYPSLQGLALDMQADLLRLTSGEVLPCLLPRAVMWPGWSVVRTSEFSVPSGKHAEKKVSSDRAVLSRKGRRLHFRQARVWSSLLSAPPTDELCLLLPPRSSADSWSMREAMVRALRSVEAFSLAGVSTANPYAVDCPKYGPAPTSELKILPFPPPPDSALCVVVEVMTSSRQWISQRTGPTVWLESVDSPPLPGSEVVTVFPPFSLCPEWAYFGAGLRKRSICKSTSLPYGVRLVALRARAIPSALRLALDTLMLGHRPGAVSPEPTLALASAAICRQGTPSLAGQLATLSILGSSSLWHFGLVTTDMASALARWGVGSRLLRLVLSSWHRRVVAAQQHCWHIFGRQSSALSFRDRREHIRGRASRRRREMASFRLGTPSISARRRRGKPFGQLSRAERSAAGLQMAASLAAFATPSDSPYIAAQEDHVEFWAGDAEDALLAMFEASEAVPPPWRSVQIGGPSVSSDLVIAYCGPSLLRLRLHDCRVPDDLFRLLRVACPALHELRLHTVTSTVPLMADLEQWPASLVLTGAAGLNFVRDGGSGPARIRRPRRKPRRGTTRRRRVADGAGAMFGRPDLHYYQTGWVFAPHSFLRLGRRDHLSLRDHMRLGHALPAGWSPALPDWERQLTPFTSAGFERADPEAFLAQSVAVRKAGVSALRLMCSSKGLSSGGTAGSLRARLTRHRRRDRREDAIMLALDLLGLRPASLLAALPSGASARRSALSALVLPCIGTPTRLFSLYQGFNSAVLCYSTTQPAAPDLAAVFPSALAAGAATAAASAALFASEAGGSAARASSLLATQQPTATLSGHDSFLSLSWADEDGDTVTFSVTAPDLVSARGELPMRWRLHEISVDDTSLDGESEGPVSTPAVSLVSRADSGSVADHLCRSVVSRPRWSRVEPAMVRLLSLTSTSLKWTQSASWGGLLETRTSRLRSWSELPAMRSPWPGRPVVRSGTTSLPTDNDTSTGASGAGYGDGAGPRAGGVAIPPPPVCSTGASPIAGPDWLRDILLLAQEGRGLPSGSARQEMLDRRLSPAGPAPAGLDAPLDNAHAHNTTHTHSHTHGETR